MAYSISSNIPAGKPIARNAVDQQTSHRWNVTHSIDALTTTSISLNTFLEANNTTKVFGKEGKYKRNPVRSHVEISNTHATATIYVAHFNPVTSAIYQYKLGPVTGYVKLPLHYDMDVYLISDTASTTLLVNEVG